MSIYIYIYVYIHTYIYIYIYIYIHVYVMYQGAGSGQLHGPRRHLQHRLHDLRDGQTAWYSIV